jgi:transcriptional regulator with XRE-family HTH domain
MSTTKKNDPSRGEPSSRSAQFGQIVRGRRLTSGTTQADLAERMNEHGFSWHQTTVNKIENGLRPITWDEAVALGTLLDLDLSACADDVQRLEAEWRELDRQCDVAEVQFRRVLQRRTEVEERIAGFRPTGKQGQGFKRAKAAAEQAVAEMKRPRKAR